MACVRGRGHGQEGTGGVGRPADRSRTLLSARARQALTPYPVGHLGAGGGSAGRKVWMLMPPGNPTAPPHRPRLVADGGTPGSARGSGLAGTHHVRSGRQSSLGDRCTCRFWGHRLPPAHTCTHGHSWGQSGPVDRLPGGNGRVAVPGWTRPSAMSGRGRTGGVPSAWPQGRRLPVPRLPADSAGGQARSAAMVTHWGPTPPLSAQPAPQTGGKSPHDSGEGRALSRVPAGLRTAEHPPRMGGTEEGAQHTAGHLACGTPGSAQPRVGGRADRGAREGAACPHPATH